MKTLFPFKNWSPPVALPFALLLIGMVACEDRESFTPRAPTPISPSSEVEQYVGDYQQMFVPGGISKRISIANLTSISIDPSFGETAFSHQVHIFGLMSNQEELIPAIWDGHAFIIDQVQVAFEGRPVEVTGRLYLFGDELDISYEMKFDGESDHYAEKYRKM